MSAIPVVKILLVDDLEENLVALDALLRSDGLEILKAGSGREALELLLVHDVALALLDVQMPDMDGFELATLMRGAERTRHVPIIFLTAGSHDAHRMFRGYEVGAVDFLFKPTDPVLVRHKVSTFVELHRQRLERERLATELREMLHLTEMFVAAVTHDLRAPLSTVIMGASIVDGMLPEGDAKRSLSRVRSSGNTMLAMLEQLYDLARARLGGGIAVDRKEAELLRLAERVSDDLRLVHPGRALRIVHDGPMTGLWDEVRLGQVLTNLVGNALRYGSPEEEVRITLHGEATSVAIEVHNAGAIPADVLAYVFDPFRRGTREKGREGLGLGLYIARQIVLAHGGTIDVDSSAGAGTMFRVRLPRSGPGGG